jgi:membrane protein DedA with SNARE-associated domain
MGQGSVDIDVSGVVGTVSWNGDVLTSTPSTAMAQGTHHWVNVTGSDLAGNNVSYSWEFTVAGNAPAQDLNWLWLLILLIIVIAVVIYYLDRRRRKKKQKKAP